MKFGVLTLSYADGAWKSRTYFNVGDYVQSFATREFYKKIGISDDDIVEINETELFTHQGDYLAVVMNLYGGVCTRYQFSPYIIPIFVGFNYVSYIDDSFKALLQKHEPIGCRDLQTLQNMRSRGIEAFFSGCITLTLDKRTKEPENGKIFLVDVPDEIMSYIPNTMREQCVTISHLYDAEIPMDERARKKALCVASERLKEYREEAKMVVTGRVHCASPCLAMGIPTIMVKANVDVNISLVEGLLPIYTLDELHKIDWRIEAPDIEKRKTKIIDAFRTKLQETLLNRTKYYSLSTDFEAKEHIEYNNLLRTRLANIVQQIGKTEFTYALWGLGAGGNVAYQLIQSEFPLARCILAIDGLKEGTFYDLAVAKPDALAKCEADFIFITTYGGKDEAIRLLTSLRGERGKKWDFLLSQMEGKV